MRYNKIHDQLTEAVARTMYQYKLSITGQKEQPTADNIRNGWKKEMWPEHDPSKLVLNDTFSRSVRGLVAAIMQELVAIDSEQEQRDNLERHNEKVREQTK